MSDSDRSIFFRSLEGGEMRIILANHSKWKDHFKVLIAYHANGTVELQQQQSTILQEIIRTINH